jgi:hypothetical protein
MRCGAAESLKLIGFGNLKHLHGIATIQVVIIFSPIETQILIREMPERHDDEGSTLFRTEKL